MKKLVILLLVTGLLGCTAAPRPKDVYEIDYPNRYTIKLSSPRWEMMDNSRELNLFAPRLVNIYLKKDTGSIFLVRSGRKSEFGIPPDYDLTTGQLIYLTKLVPHGDFMEGGEYKSENPLLERVRKVFKFQVNHPKLGIGQITAVAVYRGELLLVEQFTPKAALSTDESEFYLLLESLRERKKK